MKKDIQIFVVIFYKTMNSVGPMIFKDKKRGKCWFLELYVSTCMMFGIFEN